MERTISQEERIRRAEEIYNRRREEYDKTYSTRYNNYKEQLPKSSIKARLTKKTIWQLLICMAIYLVLYALINSNYFFSEDIHNKINQFLSYDMQFSNLYNMANSYWNNENNILKKVFNKNNAIASENETNNDISNTNSENDVNIENIENVAAIGGAENEVIEVDTRTQAEIDADYIKQNFGIIWPLKGVITSKYGTREATDIVTANHYGIDIAGNTGDTIVASMDGTVTLASTEGEYGKHIQIDNSDVSTLYAHCSKLCVSQGSEVKKGEKIAEVGQTGRATGPHLHFEVKRDGKTLDPETVLI